MKVKNKGKLKDVDLTFTQKIKAVRRNNYIRWWKNVHQQQQAKQEVDLTNNNNNNNNEFF